LIHITDLLLFLHELLMCVLEELKSLKHFFFTRSKEVSEGGGLQMNVYLGQH